MNDSSPRENRIGRPKRVAWIILGLFSAVLVLLFILIPPVRILGFQAYFGAERLGDEGVVRQQGKSDCGPAALKMILDHFGVSVTLARLAREVGVTEEGSSMYALKLRAEAYGVSAEGWKLGMAELRSASKPALAFLTIGHFVVVDSASDESVVVRDPAVGRLRFAAASFHRVWTGQILLFTRLNPESTLRRGAKTVSASRPATNVLSPVFIATPGRSTGRLDPRPF